MLSQHPFFKLYWTNNKVEYVSGTALDWTALESYKGKIEHGPFQGKYVSEIAQQDSGSLDCGVFVAIYA
ncbi:hypothetical protein P3S67_007382 [Capsicum chacoense]